MKSILGYTRTSLDTFDERPFCQVDSLRCSPPSHIHFSQKKYCLKETGTAFTLQIF